MPTIDFTSLSPERYKQIICSPSKSLGYFDMFHKPLVDDILTRKGTVGIASIACGYAHELEFFRKAYPVEKVFACGYDLNPRMLAEAKNRVPDYSFKILDVTDSGKWREQPFSFDMAIAINALIYAPEKMLGFAKHSVGGLGVVVVNLRISGNPENEPFFVDCIKCGCIDDTQRVESNGKTFVMRVMDYTKRAGELKNLGRQLYFQTMQEAADFIALSGFEIAKSETFRYHSPEYDESNGKANNVEVAGKQNIVDVLTLRPIQG